jgi:hypothetical protein
MRIVAAILAAVFVVVASAPLAFADCAGHNKAQMVKSQPQDQMTKDQPATTPLTVAEKAAEPTKPVVKSAEKK